MKLDPEFPSVSLVCRRKRPQLAQVDLGDFRPEVPKLCLLGISKQQLGLVVALLRVAHHAVRSSRRKPLAACRFHPSSANPAFLPVGFCELIKVAHPVMPTLLSSVVSLWVDPLVLLDLL